MSRCFYRKPAIEAAPETFKDVSIPASTYARLLAAKTAMKASSVEKTIERLAVWYVSGVATAWERYGRD